MRLLLDENTSGTRFKRLLTLAGHDVETVVCALGVGTDDTAVAEYAISTQRVLITQDQNDFRERYGEREHHPGLIVLYPSGRLESTAALVAAVNNIAAIYPALDDLILALNEFTW